MLGAHGPPPDDEQHESDGTQEPHGPVMAVQQRRYNDRKPDHATPTRLATANQVIDEQVAREHQQHQQ